MMIQQSNCFIVVERGVGMQNMMQERELPSAGEARTGSNMGGGQMVAADFILTPSVVFSENNAGGVGGAVRRAVRRSKAAIVAGGLKFKEAQTSMLVADSRSGVQVAAAEGSTKKADLRLGAGSLRRRHAARPAAATATRTKARSSPRRSWTTTTRSSASCATTPSLQRSVGTLKQEAAAGGVKKAGAGLNEGDVLGPKIASVKLMATPERCGESDRDPRPRGRESSSSAKRRTATSTCRAASGSGWVKIVLMQKK